MTRPSRAQPQGPPLSQPAVPAASFFGESSLFPALSASVWLLRSWRKAGRGEKELFYICDRAFIDLPPHHHPVLLGCRGLDTSITSIPPHISHRSGAFCTGGGARRFGARPWGMRRRPGERINTRGTPQKKKKKNKKLGSGTKGEERVEAELGGSAGARVRLR